MTDTNRTAIAISAGCGTLVLFVLVVGACSAVISAPDGGPRPTETTTVTATATATATATETARPQVTATETKTETATETAEAPAESGHDDAPADPPEPAEQPEPEVYYDNCTDARESGGAPVHRGDPGYGPHLDRDGDGVGCEY